LISPVRRELESLDARAVVFNVRPLDQFVADATALRRFNLWLFAAFGLLAAVLATAGVYATVNFAVAQRNREIGIRMALGAQKSEVMKLILEEGALLIGIGLLIGLSGSLALNQWTKSLLFSVSAIDPSTYFVMGGMLIIAASAASWFPARRATRVDPIQTLRSE
jgi:ABC-type antimicrobial peptide transport system permease subunit